MTSKQLAIQALEQMKGDDLYRAESAFRGMTEKQMKEEHGVSGRTRAEVLEDYRAHNARVNAAILWVQSTPGE